MNLKSNSKYKLSAGTINDIFLHMEKDVTYKLMFQKFIWDKEMRDDFIQEINLILLQYDETKLLEIYNQGSFKFFLSRIISNQIKSATSPWHTKYRQNGVVFSSTELNEDYYVQEEEINNDEKLNLIAQIIDSKIHQKPQLIREFNLFRMYYHQQLTYKQIEKITKIPYVSVYNYIKKAEDIIKKEIKKHI